MTTKAGSARSLRSRSGGGMAITLKSGSHRIGQRGVCPFGTPSTSGFMPPNATPWVSGAMPAASCRCPGSSTKRARLPNASPIARTLAVQPPRERPMAWLRKPWRIRQQGPPRGGHAGAPAGAARHRGGRLGPRRCRAARPGGPEGDGWQRGGGAYVDPAFRLWRKRLGCTGEKPAAATAHGVPLEMVKLPKAERGFVLLPRRLLTCTPSPSPRPCSKRPVTWLKYAARSRERR